MNSKSKNSSVILRTLNEVKGTKDPDSSSAKKHGGLRMTLKSFAVVSVLAAGVALYTQTAFAHQLTNNPHCALGPRKEYSSPRHGYGRRWLNQHPPQIRRASPRVKDRIDANDNGRIGWKERVKARQELREKRGKNWRHDFDNNPPGRRGGRGTNWENPPGRRGGPGAGPNRRGRCPKD